MIFMLLLAFAACGEAGSLRDDIVYPARVSDTIRMPPGAEIVALREEFVPYSKIPLGFVGEDMLASEQQQQQDEDIVGEDEKSVVHDDAEWERGIVFFEEILLIPGKKKDPNSKVVIVHGFLDNVDPEEFRRGEHHHHHQLRRDHRHASAHFNSTHGKRVWQDVQWLRMHSSSDGPTHASSSDGIGCVGPISVGFRWKNTQTKTFLLDPSGSGVSASVMIPQINTAFNDWDQYLLQHTVWGSIGNVQSVNVEQVLEPGTLGFNSISFRSIDVDFPGVGGSVLAFAVMYGPFNSTTVPVSQREILEAHIVFDEQRVWQYDRTAPQSCSYFDWYRVLLHEVGHVYGLADTFGPSSCQPHIIMWFQVNPCSDKQLQTVTSGDQCALRTLYGESPCILDSGQQTPPPPPSASSSSSSSSSLCIILLFLNTLFY